MSSSQHNMSIAQRKALLQLQSRAIRLELDERAQEFKMPSKLDLVRRVAGYSLSGTSWLSWVKWLPGAWAMYTRIRVAPSAPLTYKRWPRVLKYTLPIIAVVSASSFAWTKWQRYKLKKRLEARPSLHETEAGL